MKKFRNQLKEILDTETLNCECMKELKQPYEGKK